jgi:hypothetical protein
MKYYGKELPVFTNIVDARAAASKFFIDNFQHSGEVGRLKNADGTTEFYSKDDPAMDDVFLCDILNQNH